MESEQKTEASVSTKAKILAIVSIVITLVAWPLISLCMEETYALYICWVVWLGACLCGIMSLRAMKNIKGFLWARLSAWIGSVLSLLFALGITCIVSDRQVMDKYICSTNLHVLDQSIRTYCQNHSSEFPESSKWCDLIIDEPNNKYESKNYNPNFLDIFCVERFRCRVVTEGKCSYAFNKNLAGKRISEVDPNVVVLFETNSVGWNQNGGPEIMCPDRHKAILGESGSYVVCVGKDKPIVKFVFQSEVKNLRWNP